MQMYKMLGTYEERLDNVIFMWSDSDKICVFENFEEFDNWVTENKYDFINNYVVKPYSLGD